MVIKEGKNNKREDDKDYIDRENQVYTQQMRLQDAKKNKRDEFYTGLDDINRELNYYVDKLKNKIIFCNCDDPDFSNFYKFFRLKFDTFKIKKLITTHYSKKGKSYKLEIDKNNIKDEDGLYIPNKIKLKGNGDFRSEECIELLRESDIVITNPPFSLFREYVNQLIEYDKKFLIIGHQTHVGCKGIFPLIKKNKMWLGYGFKGDAGYFINKHYEDYAAASNHKEGMIRVSGVQWFTNLENKIRNNDLKLSLSYKENKEKYSQYVNYDAINVDITNHIPYDYEGVMGVPISFIKKFNPDQFEIVSLGIVGSCNFKNNYKSEIYRDGIATGKFTMNCKGCLYYKHDKEIHKKIPKYRNIENNDFYIAPYARILIKNKKVIKNE